MHASIVYCLEHVYCLYVMYNLCITAFSATALAVTKTFFLEGLSSHVSCFTKKTFVKEKKRGVEDRVSKCH